MTCNECEHGQLRRSCEICELRAEAEEQSRLIEKQAAEIARLRQRIDSAPTAEWDGKRVRLVVEDEE